ncbi:hypothetical protein BDFB_002437 [Asbolus verrucosus]|uniref:Uncharacterized protein n=1 Tax=Asbolus verrucosus TaxID=1661398 RepID=A0A482VJM2_ASBVE|nr:hypothetical protein BDFB_002437 [Asbolus verrucosus]
MDKGDNPKARGLKHIKNKKKYNKGKTGAHLAPPKPKSTPALASNWDRYEQEAVIQTVNSSTDFSLLANIPITHGSHFQFKSDKNIAEEINVESDKSSPLFNLDLSLLDKSLSTIPFYNRSDVDEKYFTVCISVIKLFYNYEIMVL